MGSKPFGHMSLQLIQALSCGGKLCASKAERNQLTWASSFRDALCALSAGIPDLLIRLLALELHSSSPRLEGPLAGGGRVPDLGTCFLSV